MKKALAVIIPVLLIDQASKIWIKLNFYLGQDLQIADWFIIHFTENPGMAFGLQWGGIYGKLALSVFRLAAIVALWVWLRRLIKQKTITLGIVAVALVFAGAVGNMIDSALYGMIFDRGLTFNAESGHWMGYQGVAELGGSYAYPLLGNVVDMLYFPLYQGYLPDWIPFWGGDYFVFFRPIFNIADAAITCGVIMLLLFQKKIFK